MIDRALQKELLQKFKDRYVKGSSLRLKDLETSQDAEKVHFNLKYLQGHSLIKSYNFGYGPIIRQLGEPMKPDTRKPEDAPISGEITVQGIDFLEDDGGLSAILGTVTFKLHADTIRDLIDAKIIESTAIPEQEKPALREALKGMKEEGLKQLTTRLISHGLDKGAMTAQQLWEMIGTA